MPWRADRNSLAARGADVAARLHVARAEGERLSADLARGAGDVAPALVRRAVELWCAVRELQTEVATLRADAAEALHHADHARRAGR